jgi:hypothetical protein
MEGALYREEKNGTKEQAASAPLCMLRNVPVGSFSNFARYKSESLTSQKGTNMPQNSAKGHLWV